MVRVLVVIEHGNPVGVIERPKHKTEEELLRIAQKLSPNASFKWVDRDPGNPVQLEQLLNQG